ncbi:hypothetical protein Lfu02_65360 [Longispora fulva]|uniref:2-phosphoglycerate kinase n=1 Tax=Longispora fulva TaxID=619741 RepID=A0A8J7GJ28_9ACTN|nr:hypothetical protein [Longispora fulva]MBG6137677.1 2-phosphoglycerate kinase [Longispora fulva]GIG62164.1 hypothetical protein Lfu02_65360 [Longispora fulva]
MIFAKYLVKLLVMTWDPFGTLRRVLWIGGGQWAGKSTVSNILAHRHGLCAYHFDYPNVRGHEDRLAARGLADTRTPDEIWVRTTPARMAAEVLAGFPTRFEYTLDDLRALVSGPPVLAEGWGLRPELVVPIVADPRQMIVMVPTEDWRAHQLVHLDRAGAFTHDVEDPARGQRNRIERDRLITADAVDRATALGIRVLEVDGTRDAERVADLVAEHFAPFLPPLPAKIGG